VKPASVPFWKKELSLSRGPKAPKVKAAKEPRVKKERDPDAKPFWKKELSLSRGPKADAAPSAEKAPKVKAPRMRMKVALPRRVPTRNTHTPKKIVGLKVGASQIAAATVSNNGSAELLQVARVGLEPGVVVGGELREPEKLSEALREFFKANKLPMRGVRLGVANNRIGVRTLEIEGIDDEQQLENAVRFRAQESLPIPIDEAVLDYQVLSESTGADGKLTKRILLVVAYRELVDRYVTACRKAGIEIIGVDLEAFALLRAMGAPRDEATSGAALVVVSVGHERSTFAVSDGRVCEFTRVLEWGGNALNVALARVLNVNPSEAEAPKLALDLAATTAPEGMTDEQFTECKLAVRKQIQSFARELVSSLQYYQNQPGSLSIGEIVLTGGTAHMPGLAEELQRLIGVSVRIGDPLMRVRVAKHASVTDEQSGSLAVAIGLGIED
jgi:type IV pilus assembly protein PilM